MTLRTVLERRLANGPLVLVLEDLQWADAASIEAIPTLADWLCERPLLVVLTGRPPFDPAALDCGRVAHTRAAAGAARRQRHRVLAGCVLRAAAESPFEPALAGADRSPGRRQSAVSRRGRPWPHLERRPDPRCRRSLALRCGGRQRRRAVVDRGPAALAHGPPAARGSTHAAERGDPGAALRVGAARRGGRSRRGSGAARAAVRCRSCSCRWPPGGAACAASGAALSLRQHHGARRRVPEPAAATSHRAASARRHGARRRARNPAGAARGPGGARPSLQPRRRP